MPDNIDVRDHNELEDALALAQHTVYKKYLNELSFYPLVEPNPILLDEQTKNCVRAFQITQLTCKKGEDIFQKLSTVYHASMSLGCSLFIMIDVEKINAPAKFYLGIRNADDRFKERLTISYSALRQGLESNFPGTQTRNISASKELTKKLEDIFGASTKCISSVSCVASPRSKEKTEHKAFIQGLEKMIDAMQGHTCTAIFIADPISSQQQSEIRSGYESLYSTLSSFQKSIWSYNENESEAVMESLSKGISKSVTEGTSHTQSHTTATTTGTANTIGAGINIGGHMDHNEGTTTTTGKTSPTKGAKAASAAGSIGSTAMSVAGMVLKTALQAGATAVPGGTIIGAIANGVLGVAGAAAGGSTVSESIANTIGKTMGLSGGLSLNASHTSMRSTTESDTTSDTTSHSETETTSETTTTGTTNTTGKGRTLQIENINKPIVEMLERIEEQLKRVQEGEDYGAYSCGAYFLSSKPESSLLAANTYRALMIGEGSSVESGAINSWTDSGIVETMKEYLRRFAQPVFALPLKEKPETAEDIITYSLGTTVSGLELPLHLGLPTKSIAGLPVIEHTEFGRNVKTADQGIQLGMLYHMGQIEKSQSVDLEKKSLASHTFITGSTGAGKSNTIYRMLDELDKQDVRFLVVEPAKGEYKNVFGGRENVAVFGTNRKKAELLQLNPFSFPDDTHVLEHIDRLIEIFNACWPMYAAMPAVLKDAVEQAYLRKGWDLTNSTCDPLLYPTFRDLMEVLPDVVKQSNYSADTQSDYIGSLYTRIKSLTNGINGQIFCSMSELAAEDLFDRNVIVDLSRVGSMETKALLMGILVLKLQEHRMAMAGDKMDVALQHVTVLEEAHNLLRRTADIQTQESSNLQGKSVEMIANAIAEMRTYGEGFIIADQAPGLMDESVIRNTNTKIIMRLPDESDRVLVGKAASLNDDQIVELAKLPLGVAAVYQNDWLEPVLCKIPPFGEENYKAYIYQDNQNDYILGKFLPYLFGILDHCEMQDEQVDAIDKWIAHLNCSEETKPLLQMARRGEKLTTEQKSVIGYNLFGGRRYDDWLKKAASPENAIREIDQDIARQCGGVLCNAEHIRQIILQRILQESDQLHTKYADYVILHRKGLF